MKNCQTCGAVISDDAVQCPECGASQSVNQTHPIGDDSPTVLIDGTTGYVPPMDSSMERNSEESGLQLKSDAQGVSLGSNPYPVQNQYENAGQTPYGQTPYGQMPYGQTPYDQNAYNPNDVYGQQNGYYMPQGTEVPEVKRKKTNVIAITIVAVAVVAIIAVAVWFVFFRGPANTPEGVVEASLKAINDGEYEKIADCYPDFVIAEDGDTLAETFESMDSMGIEIEITDIDAYDKDRLSDSEIADLEEDIEYWYDEKVDVEDAYTVYCSYTVTASLMGETQTDDADEQCTVIKIDGQWYIYE